MGLFGKNRVEGLAAVASFYGDIMQDSKRKWPNAKEELRAVIPNSLTKNPDLLEDNWTLFYVALARIAEEMQALRNLLPAEEAERLRELIFAFMLANPDFGEDASHFIREVDRRWHALLANGDDPMEGVATALYEVLELDETAEIAGEKFLNPITVLALGALPATMGIGWWKRFLAKNQIVRT